MSPDDLVELWRSQENGPATGGKEVLMEIRKQARKFDRTILWRDIREGVAAFGAAAVAFVIAIPTGSPWPWLGALFLSACCGAVYLRMHRTRVRHRPPREDQPLGARLRAEIAKVGAQEELLRSVGRWYIRPLTLGAVVWMASLGLAQPMPAVHPALSALLLSAAAAAILLAVGKLVARVNRLAADNHLAPLRVELEELLEQVEAG